MSSGRILVILSSANALGLKDGKSLPTGFYLNELGVPAQRLVDQGYELVLANPRGNPPTMDQSSDDDAFFENEQEHRDIKAFVNGLPQPRSFADILKEGLDGFAGLFVPGGHAPMEDLVVDRELGQILRHFHSAGKPTALICHGPAVLLAAQDDPIAFRAVLETEREAKAPGFLYHGYQLTVFSNIEEKMAELKFPAGLKWYAESALKQAGAKMDVAMVPMQSQVVRDRELVTGQNPFSDEELAITFLAMLQAARITA